MEERRGIYAEVGGQPLGIEFPGHVVLDNTFARGYSVAGETADAVVDFLVTKVYDLYLGSGFTHAFNQVV
jgi:hypothetical protein